MAPRPERPKGKSLSDLNMVWRFAAHYPGHIICAGIALLVGPRQHGVPYAFKLIIDRGFSGGGDIARWFQYLLFLVLMMALATAVRFYFVSWLGERVVADIRLAVHRNLLRLAPASSRRTARPRSPAGSRSTRPSSSRSSAPPCIGRASQPVMGVACAVILFVFAPKLAAMMLVGIALIVFP